MSAALADINTQATLDWVLAIEMFEKAEAAEISDSGRSYPMAIGMQGKHRKEKKNGI